MNDPSRMRVTMDVQDILEIRRLATIIIRSQEAIATDRDQVAYAAGGQIIETLRLIMDANEIDNF